MKNIALIIVFFVATIAVSAQSDTLVKKVKYPSRLLSIEPAIGTRVKTIVGEPDIQLTVLLQYNLSRKINFVSHTAFSNDFKNGNFNNIHNNYSYSFMQKFGIGTTFYSRKASNSFFIMKGIKYNAYSGTLKNPLLEESITTKTSGTTGDFGLMYNYKRGIKKYFFSARMYMPLKDGAPGILENATLEFGVGIKL